MGVRGASGAMGSGGGGVLAGGDGPEAVGDVGGEAVDEVDELVVVGDAAQRGEPAVGEAEGEEVVVEVAGEEGGGARGGVRGGEICGLGGGGFGRRGGGWQSGRWQGGRWQGGRWQGGWWQGGQGLLDRADDVDRLDDLELTGAGMALHVVALGPGIGVVVVADVAEDPGGAIAVEDGAEIAADAGAVGGGAARSDAFEVEARLVGVGHELRDEGHHAASVDHAEGFERAEAVVGDDGWGHGFSPRCGRRGRRRE